MHTQVTKEKKCTPTSLSSSCKLIKGVKRAAIYDLKKGLVYSINEEAKRIIDGSPDKFGFWKKLEKIGLTSSEVDGFKFKKESPPEAGLEFIWLELTTRCNLKCLHCYADGGHAGQTAELDIKSWKKIIREGFKLDCRKLQFIGGEPFLYNGLFDLALYARESGYKFIEIFTNGTFLTREAIKKIKDLEINIALSIYSNCPSIHDKITQTKGSYSSVYQNLLILKEAKVPTRVALILMKQNQKTINRTINSLKKIGIIPRPDVVRPTGRGDCSAIIPDIVSVKKWGFMSEPNFSTSPREFSFNKYWNSCWAGKIAITSKGEVLPCIFARNHIVGDLSKEMALEEVIFGEALQKLWKITKDDVEVCKDCEYRYVCSDCRPIAESTFGNLYAKNPRCGYNPYLGEWR